MNTIGSSQPVLKITTKAAKVNIRQNRPKLKIRRKRPQMVVKKQSPQFKINRSVIRVKRNSTPAVQISDRFIQMPTADIPDIVQEYWDDASIYSSYIFETNRQQQSLTKAVDLSNSPNRNDHIEMEVLSIDWDQGYFEVDWTEGVMEMEWEIDPTPEIYVEPYDIEIYVQEKTETSLKVKKHAATGTNVDKKI